MLVLTFACPLKAGAQEAALAVSAVPAPAAKRLVTGTIDDTRLVAFNAQPIPASKDLGRLSPSTPMAMQVVLRRSMEQQRALGLLEKATHDPNSPQFGKTLGPAEFAQTFGLAGSDLQAITDWLTGKGFEVVSVDNGRMAINVRGTAAQVRRRSIPRCTNMQALTGPPTTRIQPQSRFPERCSPHSAA